MCSIIVEHAAYARVQRMIVQLRQTLMSYCQSSPLTRLNWQWEGGHVGARLPAQRDDPAPASEASDTTHAIASAFQVRCQHPAHVDDVVTRMHAGGSVGTVEGDPKRDTTPKVDAVPAAAEQQAVDDSYKSGDSPYEFSKVRNADAGFRVLVNDWMRLCPRCPRKAA